MPGAFRFKRFTVDQPRAAMKVGTDGVLLGAWCTVTADMSEALDVGTGTGLIALMIAQRGGQCLTVDAVEPDGGAFLDACENFAASPWPDRLSAHNVTLQEFAPGKTYDLIACNPPYFVESLRSPGEARAAARHATGLTRDELIGRSACLSHPGTRLAVIIPAEQASDYIVSADLNDFRLSRRTSVRTVPSREAKRTLLEFIHRPYSTRPIEHLTLTIQTAPGQYTDEYRALTRDFYLHF